MPQPRKPTLSQMLDDLAPVKHPEPGALSGGTGGGYAPNVEMFFVTTARLLEDEFPGEGKALVWDRPATRKWMRSAYAATTTPRAMAYELAKARRAKRHKSGGNPRTLGSHPDEKRGRFVAFWKDERGWHHHFTDAPADWLRHGYRPEQHGRMTHWAIVPTRLAARHGYEAPPHSAIRLESEADPETRHRLGNNPRTGPAPRVPRGGALTSRKAGRIVRGVDALQEKLGIEILRGEDVEIDGRLYHVGGFLEGGNKVELWRHGELHKSGGNPRTTRKKASSKKRPAKKRPSKKRPSKKRPSKKVGSKKRPSKKVVRSGPTPKERELKRRVSRLVGKR